MPQKQHRESAVIAREPRRRQAQKERRTRISLHRSSSRATTATSIQRYTSGSYISIVSAKEAKKRRARNLPWRRQHKCSRERLRNIQFGTAWWQTRRQTPTAHGWEIEIRGAGAETEIEQVRSNWSGTGNSWPSFHIYPPESGKPYGFMLWCWNTSNRMSSACLKMPWRH